MILVMIYQDKTWHALALTCEDYLLEAATIIFDEPPLHAWAILDGNNAIIHTSEDK
jgi:hypothetical protein